MLLALVAAGACASAPEPAPPAPVAVPIQLPNEIHWVRSSAEHRAIFLQVYGNATEDLERLAAGLPAGSWAVIMDADETILDNSLFELERFREGWDYSEERWNHYVRRQVSTALPGAAEFVRRVHALGGRVAVVTNREEQVCPETRGNLDRLGIRVDIVLCRPPGASDKNPRFEAVARGTATADLPPLRVVMWIGDNIQDFPALSQDIRTAPPEAFAEFGRRYYLLPNPMYGSWERNPAQ